MSGYRVDPERIKTADSGPKAKGGQGTVVIGTLIPSGEVPICEQLQEKLLETNYAIKKLAWNRENAEESVKFFKVAALLNVPLGVLTDSL